jgi:hypothetical protein
MSNYLVNADLTIRGNLTVNGSVIYVKSQQDWNSVNNSTLKNLTDLTGQIADYNGNLVIENNLVFKCFGSSTNGSEGCPGSEECPIFIVDGESIINNVQHLDSA